MSFSYGADVCAPVSDALYLGALGNQQHPMLHCVGAYFAVLSYEICNLGIHGKYCLCNFLDIFGKNIGVLCDFVQVFL